MWVEIKLSVECMKYHEKIMLPSRQMDFFFFKVQLFCCLLGETQKNKSNINGIVLFYVTQSRYQQILSYTNSLTWKIVLYFVWRKKIWRKELCSLRTLHLAFASRNSLPSKVWDVWFKLQFAFKRYTNSTSTAFSFCHSKL